MKIGDQVATIDGSGEVIGFYGDLEMVHVQIGARYSAYRMYDLR